MVRQLECARECRSASSSATRRARPSGWQLHAQAAMLKPEGWHVAAQHVAKWYNVQLVTTIASVTGERERARCFRGTQVGPCTRNAWQRPDDATGRLPGLKVGVCVGGRVGVAVGLSVGSWLGVGVGVSVGENVDLADGKTVGTFVPDVGQLVNGCSGES